MPVAMTVGSDPSCSSGWDDLPPSPELAVRLDACVPATVDDFELIEVIQAARRLECWAQSLLLEGLSELSRRRHSVDGRAKQGYGTSEIDTIVVEEIACRSLRRPAARHPTPRSGAPPVSPRPA